jgi:uncharacterized protein YrrD
MSQVHYEPKGVEMAMQFSKGAAVRNADGKRVGDVIGVAIDPRNKEVTHLLVQKGFLFTTDRVLPIHMVASTSEDEVRLREDAADLDDLPEYQEEHYIPRSVLEAEDDHRPRENPTDNLAAPGAYWYPPTDTSIWYGTQSTVGHTLIPGNAELPLVPQVKENIPEGTTALEKGAKVMTSDGENAGSLERIFVDPESGRATHILVTSGLFSKERKAVPTWWISVMLADEVHLSIDAGFLEKLPNYG